MLALALASILPFLPALAGEFVYDDTIQILRNPLIQDPARLGEAMTTDVWGFHGEREAGWSSFWRPLFVLWLALQTWAFGFDSTAPWHAALLLLHAAVTVLAYRLARALGLSIPAAAGAALLFGVHPVHAESVAWISGAPDPLAALFALGALVLVARGERQGSSGSRAAGLALAAVALLAKEVAVTLPVLAALVGFELGAGSRRARATRAGVVGALFAVPVVGYLAARTAVLGQLEVTRPWSQGLAGELWNAPGILLFYLRQSLWPLPVGPAYPLRPIRLDADPPLVSLLLPLAGLVLLAAVALPWLRRDRVARFGVALFLLTLLPALHIDAFQPEQIVRDRYLYLPVLGVALALLVGVERLAARGWRLLTPGPAVLAFALAAAVPLGWSAAAASRTWTTELRLWERAVVTDPTSVFAHMQLAETRRAAGDLAGARRAVDLAAELGETERVRLVRAGIALEEGRFSHVVARLEPLHRATPDDTAVAERLAIALVRLGRLDRAEEVLRATREQAPWRRCSLSAQLATVLYLSGEREAALAELAAIAPLVGREPTLVCSRSALQRAALARELGRPAEARAALVEMLGATAGLKDPGTLRLRREVVAALADLGATP